MLGYCKDDHKLKTYVIERDRLGIAQCHTGKPVRAVHADYGSLLRPNTRRRNADWEKKVKKALAACCTLYEFSLSLSWACSKGLTA